MKVERYEQKYFLAIRNIRNSDEVGRVSNRYHVNAIELFSELLEGDYRVCVDKGVVLGYAGVRQPDNEVSVNVDKLFYRRGVATRLIEELVKDYDFLTAEILTGNVASEHLFERLGFEKVKTVYKKEVGRR